MSQQLPATDAVFLSIETPETPAHIGSLVTLDPTTTPGGAEGFDFARFSDAVAQRIQACPRFLWRVQEAPFGADRPYWVNDRRFRIEEHVRRIAVPAPGSTREIAELAGMLYERQLDRSRPLWEIYYIEGLQGGRVGLLWKMHHCLIDGASGAGLAELLFDLAPDAGDRPLVEVQDDARAGAPRGVLQMLGQASRNALELPLATGKHLGKAVASLGSTLREGGREALADSAPRTPLNGKVSSRRAIAWSSLPLEDVLAVKNTFGVTVNDVLLAITGESLRKYLLERDALPEMPLIAGVPVSLRKEGDDKIGNQITETNITWGTDLPDPIERLLSVHDAAVEAKAALETRDRFDFMGSIAEVLVPAAANLLIRGAAAAADRFPMPCNGVLSNVRMTPVPLYIAGAEVAKVIPISMLAPTQGFNITVVTYRGEMHFGITAEPDLVDEPWALAGGIPKALLSLQEAIASEASL